MPNTSQFPIASSRFQEYREGFCSKSAVRLKKERTGPHKTIRSLRASACKSNGESRKKEWAGRLEIRRAEILGRNASRLWQFVKKVVRISGTENRYQQAVAYRFSGSCA